MVQCRTTVTVFAPLNGKGFAEGLQKRVSRLQKETRLPYEMSSSTRFCASKQPRTKKNRSKSGRTSPYTLQYQSNTQVERKSSISRQLPPGASTKEYQIASRSGLILLSRLTVDLGDVRLQVLRMPFWARRLYRLMGEVQSIGTAKREASCVHPFKNKVFGG